MIFQNFWTSEVVPKPADFPVGWRLERGRSTRTGGFRTDIWVQDRACLMVTVTHAGPLCWVKEYTPVGETTYHFYDPKEAHAFYVSRIDTCPLCDYEEGTQ